MVEIIRIEVFPNTTNFNFADKVHKKPPIDLSKYWKLLLVLSLAQAFTNLIRFADALPMPQTPQKLDRFPRHFPIQKPASKSSETNQPDEINSAGAKSVEQKGKI